MNIRLPHWFQPYAGWAALALTLIAFFVSLVGSNAALPLSLLAVAIAIAAVRYWDVIKSFDFWAFDEWIRARYDSLGVREWHSPYHAVEMYCSSTIAKARNEAAAEMNTIMMELIRAKGPVAAATGAAFTTNTDSRLGSADTARRHASYDAAQTRHNQCNTALSREVIAQLIRGDLIAKGLPLESDVAKSERIIPASRWRVMSLDISKAKASGSGLSYEGIVLGKKPHNPKIALSMPGPQPKHS
jgi:hypothetical protein